MSIRHQKNRDRAQKGAELYCSKRASSERISSKRASSERVSSKRASLERVSLKRVSSKRASSRSALAFGAHYTKPVPSFIAWSTLHRICFELFRFKFELEASPSRFFLSILTSLMSTNKNMKKESVASPFVVRLAVFLACHLPCVLLFYHLSTVYLM